MAPNGAGVEGGQVKRRTPLYTVPSECCLQNKSDDLNVTKMFPNFALSLAPDACALQNVDGTARVGII